MNNNLQNYMIVQFPIYIDWNMFGENISEDKKTELLKTMTEDLVDKPLFHEVPDLDDMGTFIPKERVEGIITSVNNNGNDELFISGLIWMTSELETSEIVDLNTGKKKIRFIGIHMDYAETMNAVFQDVVSKHNKILKDINKKNDILEREDEKK